MGFAYGVTISKYRALGIYLYRSAFPLSPQERLTPCFGQLLEARDRLNLPPDDPFSDYIDERLADDKDDGKDAAILRQAQRSLEAKAQEVNELKESLAQLQNEITRREQKRAVVPQPAIVAAPVAAEDPALKELRRKVGELKSALNERHHERNDLRRELQKAHTDLETLRQSATPPPRLMNQNPIMRRNCCCHRTRRKSIRSGSSSFRRDFNRRSTSFPRHVARAAVIMVGRLAAGEPAAFVGALRLKATPNVMRQRIGSDYRLLFRLHPEQVQVIDLINRKDLDRRLKTLA